MIHEFTPADRQSTWFKRLSDSIELRIEKLREKNDGAFDSIATASIRGQITLLKEFRADMMEKPSPKPATKRNPYQ